MVSWRTIPALLGALWIALGSSGVAVAADTDQSKTAGGVTVYLGVVPAEIVKGLPASNSTERPMHGRIPKGPHEYHIVAAVFDVVTGSRISDAAVTAEVSGFGLSGSKRKLDPTLTCRTELSSTAAAPVIASLMAPRSAISTGRVTTDGLIQGA
jgi:hypothetical protein